MHTAEAFLVLIIVAVSLRMYVRMRITRQFGFEDWAMVVTFIFALAQSSLSISSCYLALGLFKGTTNVNTYSWTVRCASIFYVLTMMALKVSLGLFFLNIFHHRKLQTILIWIIMVVSVVIGFAYWPVGFITCAEIKASSGYTATCPRAVQTAASALFDIFSVVNIGGDLILVYMSCSAIWEAKLPVPTKISASTLIALGAIGAVASTVRFVLVVEPASPDRYTQELLDIYKWIIIEIGVCVIATNLVMIRPLFNMLLIHVGLLSRQGSTSHGVTTIGGTGQKSSRRRTHATEMDEAPLTHNFPAGGVKREVTIVVSDEENAISSYDQHSHAPSFDGSTVPRHI